MGTLSSILAGLGQGLKQAGSMGLEYSFNSKLQGERLAAEEKRQMRITEIEQGGLDKRLSQTLGAENLRAERAMELSKQQHGESMAKLQAQIDQAKANNDIARMNALTAERNALTAEKTGASQVLFDKERIAFYRANAQTKAETLDQKGLTTALEGAKTRYKSLSTALTKAQNAAMGTVTPEVQELTTKLQETEIQMRTYEERSAGVLGTAGNHLAPAEHPDVARLRKSASMEKLIIRFMEHPDMLKPDSSRYRDFMLSSAGNADPGEIEEAKGHAIHRLYKIATRDKH